MTQRAVMIAEVHKEIEPSAIITCPFCMWHFSDTPVQIQLSGNSNRFYKLDIAPRPSQIRYTINLPNALSALETSGSHNVPIQRARTSSNS